MGLYGNKPMLDPMTEAAEVVENVDELLEAFIAYELSQLTEAQFKAFTESEECQAMLEKRLVGRNTLVRLSKNDDLTRRTKMAAFQIAKEKDDPLWQKLVKNRIKERQLIAAIVKKYGMKGQRAAKVGQRQYLTGKLPAVALRPERDEGDGPKPYKPGK